MAFVRKIVVVSLMLMIAAMTPSPSWAIPATGQDLFNNHCSGCHVNGGNIIRRGRTLKMAALKRNGIDNPEAIARIAREGIGQMSGYAEALGEGGDQIVAEWIWEQAQNAWTQG